MSFPGVQRWLAENTPLEPSLLEGAAFDALIGERIAARGGGEPAYIAALEASAEEVERLTAGIAVPETWFFRYPRSYILLGDVLRRWSVGGAPIRIASIGCATGEEPCSIAMVAHHAGLRAGDFRVDAMDSNRGVLMRAEAGEYGPASIRGELPAWAAEFMARSGPSLRIDPAVRALVGFRQADATRGGLIGADGPYRAIFCRNLLIYLRREARQRLLDSVYASLEPGGLLFVGHAEPLLCIRPGLRPVQESHAFCLERCAVPGPGAGSVAAAPASPRRVPQPQKRERPIGRAEGHQPGLAAAAAEATVEEARDLADAGRIRECETMVRRILARRGPSAEAFELLGTVRIASNDAEEARVCFERAVYLEPMRVASILQLALIYEKSGDAARAGVCWDRARRAATDAAPERRP